MQDTQEARQATQEVSQAMERLTRAVVEGREPAERLATALQSALAETASLAAQLGDETFSGDEPSQQFRAAALGAVEELDASLASMMEATHPELRPDDLLAALERALAAQERVAEGYLALHATYGEMREAMQAASQVTCVRCGTRNPPGRMTCSQCRMQLPQTGVERIETDIIGGDEVQATSAYVSHLEELIAGLGEPEGVDRALEFLKRLGQIYTLALKQLDLLLSRVDPEHEAVQMTADLRHRIDDVRSALDAAHQALEAGDAEPLAILPPWLTEQFYHMSELKTAIAEATAG